MSSCVLATSDNLEAISEAASSHSVGSDLDNENDNLSDMVSANVSGRGTPNVSGRDTPISQADSQVGRSAVLILSITCDSCYLLLLCLLLSAELHP